MHSSEHTVLKDIVLVGGGHSHVGVLRRFGMRPLPGVRLTVICTDTLTPYSGMLPGYIAGHYSFDEVHIDLRRLAEFAGARYYLDEVVGIDRESRCVLCRRRPPVSYDRLSINIGSAPAMSGVVGADEYDEYIVPVKPIRRFNERWLALLERVRRHRGQTTIAVVGAGAGGVELTLAMQYRLRRELAMLGRDPDDLRFHLLSADHDILRTHNARVRRSFEEVLAARGVVVHRAAEVSSLSCRQLGTRSGETLAVDEIVWVTQAAAAAWLRDTGLALDAGGFIQVADTLQTVSDPLIFAAGDCAAMIDTPLEKAGVFAVRQGRPLAENLRHALLGEPLRAYRPQRRWLALISTGDRYAVASRGALSARGAWVWRWKDWVDRRFVARYNDLPALPGAQEPPLPLAAGAAEQALTAAAMRCGDCAAEVGATVLTRALAGLHPIARDDVLTRLQAPDGVAIVRVPPGKATLHKVDFLRAFIDDPWLFGGIAANQALSGIFAMGGEAQSATAIATLPAGLDSKVEDTLFQMLAGVVEVLNTAGCALVGVHAGEGSELALGLAINGLVDADLAGVLRTPGMRPGELLILSKALGTGTLFAAHARLRASGRCLDAALVAMRQSNRRAAACLHEHAASACSAVSAGGLLGQLLAMTGPAGVAVELDPGALPVLDGAAESAAQGLVGSLQAANRRWRSALRNLEQGERHANYPLLFDPQTAGGLLASVPAASAAACLQALHSLGYEAAACIGRVLVAGEHAQPIQLKLPAREMAAGELHGG